MTNQSSSQSSNQSSMSVAQLVSALEQKGHAVDVEALKAHLAKLPTTPNVPLYLRILAGVGGFLAAILFLFFIGVAGIVDFDQEASLLVTGIVLIGAAFGTKSLIADAQTLKGTVLSQISLCFMAAGKTVFVIGLAATFENVWAVPIGFLLVTLVTYRYFGQGVDRFLSPVTTLIVTLLVIIIEAETVAFADILFHLFLLAQLGALLFIWLHPKVSRLYVPLGYALIVSVGVQMCFLSATLQISSFAPVGGVGALAVQTHFWLAKVEMGLALGLVIYLLAGGSSALKRVPIQLALVGVVALALVTAPGVLYGILLLVLGHALSRQTILALGGLMMIFAIYFFYYNLDVTLLIKSFVLMASGLILCVAGYVVHKKGWAKQAPVDEGEKA